MTPGDEALELVVEPPTTAGNGVDSSGSPAALGPRQPDALHTAPNRVRGPRPTLL